jgi:hypothetical protein
LKSKLPRRNFRKKKKTTNPYVIKLGPVYSPTTEDLLIARDKSRNPDRFNVLVGLNSLELAKTLWASGQLEVLQMQTILLLICNLPKSAISTLEKSTFAYKAYEEMSRKSDLSLSNYNFLRNLVTHLFNEQSDESLKIIKLRIKSLMSELNNESLRNYGIASNRLNLIRESDLWPNRAFMFQDPSLFWDMTKIYYFSRLEGNSTLNEVTNLKSLDLLSNSINFKPNSDFTLKYDSGLDSNPIYFLYVLKARIIYRKKSEAEGLGLIFKTILFSYDQIEDDFKRAQKILQTRAMAEKVRITAEKAAKAAENDRRLAEVASIKEKLVKFRAEGHVNAEYEFSAFLKDLHFVDGEDWTLDKLANFLSEDFVLEMEPSRFHIFLNKSFRTLDHPLISYLCQGSRFEITTSDGAVLEFTLKGYEYAQYDLRYRVLKVPDPSTARENSMYSRRYPEFMTSMLYASSWGLKQVLENFLKEKGVSVKSAKFYRVKTEVDFLNLIALVYANPISSELVSLYFSDWKFFTDGYPCEKCGRDLTHSISAVKGVGPVCGDHRYALESSDADRVARHLAKLPKSRLLNRDSPLIKSRLNQFQLVGTNEKNLLHSLEKRVNVSHSQLLSLIDVQIRSRRGRR